VKAPLRPLISNSIYPLFSSASGEVIYFFLAPLVRINVGAPLEPLISNSMIIIDTL